MLPCRRKRRRRRRGHLPLIPAKQPHLLRPADRHVPLRLVHEALGPLGRRQRWCFWHGSRFRIGRRFGLPALCTGGRSTKRHCPNPNSKLGEHPIRSTGPPSSSVFFSFSTTATPTTNNGILCPPMMAGQAAVLGFVPAHKGFGPIVAACIAAAATLRRAGPRRPTSVGNLRSSGGRHGPRRSRRPRPRR